MLKLSSEIRPMADFTCLEGSGCSCPGTLGQPDESGLGFLGAIVWMIFGVSIGYAVGVERSLRR